MNKSLAETCLEIYNQSGQDGVYAYITANHPKVKWRLCEPCEIISPLDPSTLNNACLVCSSFVDYSPSDEDRAKGKEIFHKCLAEVHSYQAGLAGSGKNIEPTLCEKCRDAIEIIEWGRA